MQPVLSPAACHFLRQLQPKVAAQGRVKKSTHQKAVQEVLSWCIAHQLPDVAGNCLKLPTFYFSQQLLKHIAEVQKQLRQPEFSTDYKELQRTDVALVSDIEQKSIGIKPRDQRVLVRLLQAEPIANGLVAQVVDVAWQSLPLQSFDALVVVENLDCFYQLERFTLALPYQQPLIIYRGDKLYGKGGKALCATWHTETKPIIYFGDADLAGITIALSLNCQSILLPGVSEFQRAASSAMLADQQLKYQQRLLQMSVSSAFLPYKQLLCQQLKGLRQQNMQGLVLHTVGLF